jgi:hypothetical protein
MFNLHINIPAYIEAQGMAQSRHYEHLSIGQAPEFLTPNERESTMSNE